MVKITLHYENGENIDSIKKRMCDFWSDEKRKPNEIPDEEAIEYLTIETWERFKFVCEEMQHNADESSFCSFITVDKYA